VGNLTKHLLNEVTAGEVMLPSPLSIRLSDSIATVADYFLKTRFEALPVTDHEGKLIGIVSETDVISMIGRMEHWVSPIKPLVFSNAASYPTDTPIQTIIDFLYRTSVRRVMIVQNGILVGYICRTPLLRWLRNQWAMMSGHYDSIVPNLPTGEVFESDLSTAIKTLKEELAGFDTVMMDNHGQASSVPKRTRLASIISQCQDIMDQVLKYGSIPTTNDSAILPPEPGIEYG
jgi:predicted transcriptional regulator